eukprot:gb/GECH01003365.1/.p1 GENE.gb/GECH01003365.1/~~gb/GECH01003365.1/.p1  ORF type:complete len:385 (+),score=75.34 gb/GECH01003365.1/:1-1155(+)
MYQELRANNFITVDTRDIKGGLLWTIVKNLRVGADLTHISAPPSMLRAVSTLEMIAYSFSGIHFFQDVNNETNHCKPQDRLLALAKWYILGASLSCLSHVYGTKPYNPVLGEYFRCHWDNPSVNSDQPFAYFVAEQVSHHPPVTAHELYIPEEQLRIRGDGQIESKFHGNTAETYINGALFAEFQLADGSKDTIRFDTSPTTYATGLIYGRQRIGVRGKLTAFSEDLPYGLSIKFSKDKNYQIHGEVFYVDEDNQGKRTPLYRISGSLIGNLSIVDAKSGAQLDCFDFSSQQSSAQLLPYEVIPIENQDGNEARRVWHDLTEALYRRDDAAAIRAKHVVEEEQRNLKKERSKNNDTDWNPNFFYFNHEERRWLLKNHISSLFSM